MQNCVISLKGQNWQDLRLQKIQDNVKCKTRYFKNHSFEIPLPPVKLLILAKTGVKTINCIADRELGILLYQNEHHIDYFLVTRKKHINCIMEG